MDSKPRGCGAPLNAATLMVINAAQALRLHRGPRCLYQFEAVRADGSGGESYYSLGDAPRGVG